MYPLKIKLLSFLFSVLFFSSSLGSTALYQSATSGDWNSLLTWKRWNGVAYITPTLSEGVPSSADSTITILTTHTITVSSNVTVDELIINTGGSIIINSTVTLTLLDGAGNDLNISTGASVIDNGTIINSGTIITAGTLTFASGSLYQHNFTSAGTTRGVVPTATWAEGATCEILACGNSFAPSGLAQTFYNFIWNNATQPQNFNLVANPTTVNGNFEIKNTNGFQLRYKSSTSGDLTILKSLIISGGNFVLTNGSHNVVVTIGEYFYQTAGTFDLSTSTDVSANGSLYISRGFLHTGGVFRKSGTGGTSCEVLMNSTTSSTIESIGFNSGDNIAFNITQSVGAACRILSNKIFTINPGTTFTVNNNGTTSADLTVDGTLAANTNTWNFASGVSAISNGGLFLNNSLLIGTSSAATLIFNSGSVFRQNVNGGKIAFAGWDKNSTLEITGITSCDSVGNGNQSFGKIVWNCPSQTSSATFGRASSIGNFSTQSNYTISSTGIGLLHFPDLDFTIGGNLTVENDAQLQISTTVGLYSPGTRIITINGNTSITGTALLTVGSPNKTSVAMSTDKFRDYIFVMKKDFTCSSSTPMISYCQRNFSGANNDESYRLLFNFNGGITQYINSPPVSSQLISVSADEYISNNLYEIKVSGISTDLVALSDIKSKSFQVDADNTLTASGASYNLTSYSLLTEGGAIDNPTTVINGTLDLGLSVLTDATGSVGTFTLNDGAGLLMMNADGIDSIGATGCIQNTGTRTFSEAAHYTYNGTSNQITGSGLRTLLTGSLTINNSTGLANGGVTLSKPTVVKGILNLTSGRLITSSSLTIDDGGSVFPEGGQSTSFVDGPIKKIGFTGGAEFVFPTGDSSKWARIGYTSTTTSATNAFAVEYFKESPTNIDTTLNRTVTDRELDAISVKEYWDIDRVNGSGEGKVKLYWEDADYSGISNTLDDDLRLAHYYNPGTGLKWYGESDVAPFVTTVSNGVTGTIESVADFSSFEPVTFGSKHSVNPLPIELISFTGYNINGGNQLNWKTATEINNNYFEVQRSADASIFSKIAVIKGAENSIVTKDYSYFDSTSLEGINYYRLKQVDHNGQYIYSAVIAVNENILERSTIKIYPNPTNDKLHINISNSIASISIYNMFGELVYNIFGHTFNEIDYSPSTNGVYFISATDNAGKTTSMRFVKN
jgi:hypothetical protein